MKVRFWKWGERAELAKASGIRVCNLYEILNRSRGVSPQRALKLEKASGILMPGRSVSFRDWLFNRTSKHKAFCGKPLKLKD